MMLEVQGLSLGYGGDAVLQSVDLGLEQGEIVTLVGANGAGKSTLVKGISGLLQPLAGRVTLDGADLNGLDPAERLRRGIAHVPEGRQVFAGMTVLENLQLGAYLERRGEPGLKRSARSSPSCATGCMTSPATSPAGSSRCWQSRAG